jgi:hypothetical protein
VAHEHFRVEAERLEQRCLLAAPAIDAVVDVTVPASRSLTLPITATDADSDRLT